MLYIKGRNITKYKKVLSNLNHIYGIGNFKSKEILRKLGLSLNILTKDLTRFEEERISHLISTDYVDIESNVKLEKKKYITKQIELKSYRGRRHQLKLPVRGQRTHSNARTCKK